MQVPTLGALVHAQGGGLPTRACLQTPRFALRGRVLTMETGVAPIGAGVVYVAGDTIAAVQPAGAAAPPGFEAASRST